jgi:hypothetical protein
VGACGVPLTLTAALMRRASAYSGHWHASTHYQLPPSTQQSPQQSSEQPSARNTTPQAPPTDYGALHPPAWQPRGAP